jgi:hypothetical protein
MRSRIFLLVLLTSIFNSALVFAQSAGGPCAFQDADNPCPLDTWVIVLAFAAVLFAVFHLHRKQKSPLSTTEGIV